MQRELLFRGMRVDKKEMVYGDLIHGVGKKNGTFFIVPIAENLADHPECDWFSGYEVIPETVGQYTGMTDKEGNKIFEGDHLKRVVSVDGEETTYYDRVISQPGHFATIDLNDPNDTGCYLSEFLYTTLEVIGNIHEKYQSNEEN